MTGYQSKKAAAQAKLQCQCSMSTKLVGSGCQYCNPEYMDDHIPDARKMVAQPAQERNFCSRCGKRTADLTVIHTCTPPQGNT
jgi:hypothetical protein